MTQVPRFNTQWGHILMNPHISLNAHNANFVYLTKTWLGGKGEWGAWTLTEVVTLVELHIQFVILQILLWDSETSKFVYLQQYYFLYEMYNAKWKPTKSLISIYFIAKKIP